MKNPAVEIAAKLDALRKAQAKSPMLATGGDGRLSQEAINTAAMHRAQGAKRVKIAVPRTTVPMQELVKRR